MKSTAPIEELAKNMAWVPRSSPGRVRFIGASELLGGVGLLLPALTRLLPVLTPVAASALTLVMVLAAGELHDGAHRASLTPGPPAPQRAASGRGGPSSNPSRSRGRLPTGLGRASTGEGETGNVRPP